MLSDEEKEAIEWLKRLVKINKRDNLDNTFAEILLNLIEKQSKEIEELIERIKELELDKEIKDKTIEMYIEHIYKGCDFDNRIKTKEQIKQYFENLAKESGEIDEC